MGKTQDIIRRHVGNPEGLIGLLEDMVYHRASQWLGNYLLEVYRAELASAAKIEDEQTKRFILVEANRVKALADELLAIEPYSLAEADRVIANRYMINPNMNVEK